MPSLIYAPVPLLPTIHCKRGLRANKSISQVFLLLVFEMVVFMGLIVPMPFTMKRKLFTFLAESPIVAKLQYGMKVINITIKRFVHPRNIQLITETIDRSHSSSS
jgi:Bap31/Bap29 transmembrane region